MFLGEIMIYSFNKLSFQILSIDEYQHSPGKIKVLGRPFSALSFRTKGEGIFKVANTSFISKVGDIVFIPQGVDYEVEYSNSASIVYHLTDCNYLIPEHLENADSNAYKLLFEQALNDWKKDFSTIGAKATLYSILKKIADEKNFSLVAKNDLSFSDCVEYVKENFTNPNLNLKFLSQKFFISEATLRRKFHKYFGLSFIEYLLKLKFDKAISLLLSGKEKISFISHACGFEDEKYFSRAIKKRFGFSPSEISK